MRGYVAIFVALLVLTTLTLVLSFVHLPFAAAIALTIAAIKAALILYGFMHLLAHRTSSVVTFAVALLLTLTFVGLTTLDVLSRGRVADAPPLPEPGAAARAPR